MKIKLVTHWRLWWRRWSTWCAALYAAATAAVFANPGLLMGLVGYFPAGKREFVAGAVAVICFVVPVLVTSLRQTKLQDAVQKDRADAGR